MLFPLVLYHAFSTILALIFFDNAAPLSFQRMTSIILMEQKWLSDMFDVIELDLHKRNLVN